MVPDHTTNNGHLNSVVATKHTVIHLFVVVFFHRAMQNCIELHRKSYSQRNLCSRPTSKQFTKNIFRYLCDLYFLLCVSRIGTHIMNNNCATTNLLIKQTWGYLSHLILYIIWYWPHHLILSILCHLYWLESIFYWPSTLVFFVIGINCYCYLLRMSCLMVCILCYTPWLLLISFAICNSRNLYFSKLVNVAIGICMLVYFYASGVFLLLGTCRNWNFLQFVFSAICNFLQCVYFATHITYNRYFPRACGWYLMVFYHPNYCPENRPT